jgi:diacylglycerol kinase (ATP)
MQNAEQRAMPESVIIFANPIAGRGKGKTLAQRLERELIAAGVGADVFFDRPTDLSLVNLPESPKAAIAIGGDGTLRSVVNLFFSESETGPPILPVPMGTANLMGHHLGIHWPERGITQAIIETIRQRKILKLDAGRANGKLFLLMAGVGIDAQIVHLLDLMRRGPINMASYLIPAAMTFASYTFPPITVWVDNQMILRNKPAIAMIGNVREYGIGFPILPDATPYDGLLDVCVMPCKNRMHLIEILVDIAAGEHVNRDDVIYTKGKNVQVDSPKPLAVQVDGDSAGFTPLTVDLLPGRIPFLLPVEGRDDERQNK